MTLVVNRAAGESLSSAQPISLYLHIPFCSLKCSYCDFNSYAGLESLVPAFVDAMATEIGLWAPCVRGRPVTTVYFGGGTPSLLPLNAVHQILDAVGSWFDVADGAEVSFEANPGTVDLAYLSGLRDAGITRLSLGVQSFDDAELASLDRIHTAAEAIEGYRAARLAGIGSINLDLIYGLPGQSLKTWQKNVARATDLSPDHLSCYALTIEDGTRLAYEIASGRVAEPDADLQAEMYEWAQERLSAAGLQQYEISNWARPGHECRHNLVYWRNGEWLGMGPGAHSHWASFRFANVYSPRRYIEAVADAVPAADDAPESVLCAMPQVVATELQTPATAMADAAILALRLNEGLDCVVFEERFGVPPSAAFDPAIDGMMAAGLLERSRGRLQLTPRGRLLANEVFVRLLPD